MNRSTDTMEHRRHTRIPLSVPLIVTSLNLKGRFQGRCDALDVSSNGAQLLLSRSLPLGTRLRLDILNTDRITEGCVVRSNSCGRYTWRVGIQLPAQMGNFWGLISPPEDWNPSHPARDPYEQWIWVG